jgi:hypothetical protein
VQRAAVVFRVEWELDQLAQYEEAVQALFARHGYQPWPTLLDLIAELRAERQKVLASGSRPVPLMPEESSDGLSSRRERAEVIRPVTTRVNSSGRSQDVDLGLLPDADFILDL